VDCKFHPSHACGSGSTASSAGPRPAATRAPSRLRAAYTALAPFYDRLVPLVSSRARSTGHTWLAVRDGERVLDLGTGTGLSLAPLVAANPHGWTAGVDATPAMLRRARARLADTPDAQYDLRRAEAGALPYATNTFDAVYSSYLIDVLPRDRIRPGLAEVRRVLRDDGRLVVVFLTPPTRPIGRLWACLARLLPPLFGGARPVEVRPALRQAGFSVQRSTARTQIGLRSAIVRAAPR
jgi:demethylmenaquinone methyltransferase/2-methoxy-6-polyprenyl-1,4-benzoquinol methylase